MMTLMICSQQSEKRAKFYVYQIYYANEVCVFYALKIASKKFHESNGSLHYSELLRLLLETALLSLINALSA